MPIIVPRRHIMKPVCGTQLDRSHPLARGLTFCLPCNEGGGSPRDLIRGVQAVATNGATWGAGPGGAALSLDGTNDYYACGDADQFSISTSGAMTIVSRFMCATLPPTSSGQRMWLAAKGASSNWEWALSINDFSSSFGCLVATVWDLPNFTTRARPSVTTITPGRWTSCAVVFPSTTGLPDVYLDGRLDNGTATNGGGTSTNGTAPMCIGERSDGGDNTWNGRIEYMSFYGRALSADEVAELHRAPYQMFLP